MIKLSLFVAIALVLFATNLRAEDKKDKTVYDFNMKDIDGKAFVQERVDLARANASFWQTYKFTNPVSKKIESKSAYCERLGDVVVCGGVYK